MSKRVLLHVGTPKTGTSYLQHVLFHNRRALREHGISYPADRFDALVGKLHYCLMSGIASMWPNQERPAGRGSHAGACSWPAWPLHQRQIPTFSQREHLWPVRLSITCRV